MEPLKKLKHLTTETGIYQHANLSKPDPVYGYALEDQARALLVASRFKEAKLCKTYLNFIINAKREDGLLYHFYFENNNRVNGDVKGFYKNEEFNSTPNNQEAWGITLWSVLATKNDQNKKINGIIRKLICAAVNWTSPRAMSAALLGVLNYKNEQPLENIIKTKLFNLYYNSRQPGWDWFENYLVYANAIIPWALWDSYIKRNCKISFDIAKKTTDFLINVCQEKGISAPVGNKGWFIRGAKKAVFDQQPIDAAYMVCCLEKAYYATSDTYYLNKAKNWYEWFWGRNIKKTALIDDSFACYDALTEKGINLNQGAESNICFLFAYLAANRLDRVA